MPRPIVLCSDFGPASPYVGQLELAAFAVAPAAARIHLAHDLPPQQIAAAALVLTSSLRLLPPDSILCGVIDPGVGSDRRILALELAEGRLAVVPDNGLAAALAPRRAVQVANQALFAPRVSPVFHGRDIFAPVAAHLSLGMPLTDVGPAVPVTDLVPLPVPIDHTGPEGEVIYCDPFGNLVTNLLAPAPRPDGAQLRVAGHTLDVLDHYAAAPAGALLALAGSFGNLEIAVRDGSAAAVLGTCIGEPVCLVAAAAP